MLIKSWLPTSGKHALFLATVVKTENGSVDDHDYEDYMGYDICHEPQHRIYDVEKSSFALSHVVEPEDLTFAEDVEIDDDAIFVQEDPFYDDPDVEEFSGYSQYRGATATHLYYRTVKRILCPPPHRQMVPRLIAWLLSKCFRSQLY